LQDLWISLWISFRVSAQSGKKEPGFFATAAFALNDTKTELHKKGRSKFRPT
jgi:hypothetical protein